MTRRKVIAGDRTNRRLVAEPRSKLRDPQENDVLSHIYSGRKLIVDASGRDYVDFRIIGGSGSPVARYSVSLVAWRKLAPKAFTAIGTRGGLQ